MIMYMNNDLPTTARVVVIGGGIAGCSVAYHLATLGVRDTLLLERSSLSSGTTWHSTGNMETYRHDPLIFEMVQYATKLYPRLAQDTGNDIGWRAVGRVMYTDREERWREFRAFPELARARGIDIELLTADEVGRKLPIIETSGLIGGVWVPSDARVNPTDAVTALASQAKARGVKVLADAPVLGIITSRGTVKGVVTKLGTIDCETVVIAAGLWSAEIARSCEAALPLYALEHQYLITKPMGVSRNLPLFISYDDQLYGREEVGGLIVGSLDDSAIPLSSAELPQNFSFSLLNERWDQFERYMDTAMRRFPALRSAEAKMLLNGPETFTPDGHMLLGPVPGTDGVFACCGFNSNGMALAPAAGKLTAEWIVEGEPSMDVTKLDARRFSAVQCNESYLRDRVTEIPGHACRIPAALSDYTTARNIRKSPLHESLLAAGAYFGGVNGWERPLWISRDAPHDEWLAAVEAEVLAANQTGLLVDRSADVKVLLTGELAQGKFVEPAAGGWPTQALMRPLTGRNGRLEALVRVLPLAPEQVLLAASPDQETRVQEWLRCNCGLNDISTRDVSSEYVLLELYGPERKAWLRSLRVSAAPEGNHSRMAQTPAGTAYVHEDLLGGSTLLLIPGDGAADLCRQLDMDLRKSTRCAGGHFAEEAMRIIRGIPAFGREATQAGSVDELLSLNVPAHRHTPPTQTGPKTRRRRLIAYESPMSIQGFGTDEPIVQGSNVVGTLTSRVRLPSWHMTLALGLLDAEVTSDLESEVIVAGTRWPLLTRRTIWNTPP